MGRITVISRGGAPGESIELPIEKLSGLGDGCGFFKGRKVFVPYTLPGDEVRATIVKDTKDAVFAYLERVVVSGPGRIAPVCKHFSVCGGCALQHVNEDAYRSFKQGMAREAARKAGYDPDIVGSLIRLPTASRRRVELKVEQGRLGYYAQRSHRLVAIEECKVLEPELEAFVLRLKQNIAAFPGLSRIQINSADNGYDVLLEGKDTAAWRWFDDATAARISVKDENGLRTLAQRKPATFIVGDVSVSLPPGAFMQVSMEAQQFMTHFVLEVAAQANKILDLFAGLGTYSFPLTAHADVTAIEGDIAMVNAMREAAASHPRPHLFNAVQRDLFLYPVTKEEAGAYDAVVINPPRLGAKEQCAELAGANLRKLVMISCNPATFARDARLLKDGGFKLVKLTPLDQFIYSTHLEIMAEFTK